MQLRFKVAGMTDMGLVRKNNEDNFQISRDLSVEPMRWINNETCLLTPQGALLVVADGMGGMNAGEVASQIAIDTMKELFTPANIARVNLANPAHVNEFLKRAVVEADSRIKATAASNPETHGMGTTIVIGWLIDGLLYVAWCGDSRAYVFNQTDGLRRLSKDHSYVQSLVDMGQLTEEQAFDFPQSNIITRCLCDTNQVAEADVLVHPYEVADGDIILLCTDGLCGMIRDNEIRNIMANGPADDLTAMAQALIDGALRAAGSDNVTIAMLQVISRGKKPAIAPGKRKSSLPLISLAGVAVGTLLAWGLFSLFGSRNNDDLIARADRDEAVANSAVPETVPLSDYPEPVADNSEEGRDDRPEKSVLDGKIPEGSLETHKKDTPRKEEVKPTETSSTTESTKTREDIKHTEETQKKVAQSVVSTNVAPPGAVPPPPAKKSAAKELTLAENTDWRAIFRDYGGEAKIRELNKDRGFSFTGTCPKGTKIAIP